MHRRTFLRTGSTLTAASLLMPSTALFAATQPKFSLNYAPHPGTFKS